ncbi:MAG: xylulokinase [Kosmotogaceae bacterium]
MSYIIAYDLGTTGNKATLYDIEGKLLANSFSGYNTFYPGPNQVEQDPEEWWKSVKKATSELISKANVSPSDIKAISFSGQMMGAIPVDKNGKVLRKAIIWADQRSVEQASRLEKIGNENVYKLTGTKITPTYSGPKIAWIKDNEPKIYEKAYKFLNAKDYIALRFTGEFGTDHSDASMTLLLDIKKLEWSEKLVNTLGLDMEKLPPVSSSDTVVSTIIPSVAEELGLSKNTLIVRGGGDGACACLGAGVVSPDEAYVYLGSSSWASTCSTEPLFDEDARTFNFAYPIEGFYCPTGTMQAGGASYQWAKDALCQLEAEKGKELGLSAFTLMDDLVDLTKPGAGNLIFLPYLLGERSPRWNINARGAFIGLSSTHRKPEMLRAVLEGVAFNLKIILDILETKGKFDKIRLIGGGAKGRNWKQIIADIFGKTVTIPEYLEEATSMGAAILGAVGAGEMTFKEASRFVKDIQFISPNLENKAYYEKLFKVFDKAYFSLLETYEDLAKM